MFRKLIAKGNLHPSDHFRAVVTDTSPGDVPIIFSNDGFYKNLKGGASTNVHQKEFVELLLKPEKPYTLPYRYNILRGGIRTRQLSLTHPSSQLAVADFYKDFAHLICYYSRKSIASIRSPRKIGSSFFVRGPFSEANNLKGAKIDTVDIENTRSNPASYFAYSGYDRAYKFFESADYLRLEKRYGAMYFTDISKCFSSIYTHTLYWAVTDVLTAKDNTQAATFSNKFDRLMQSMNFNETNGICIGAEISRVFAEVILSECDKKTVEILEGRGLVYRKDYEFRRYVDDYFIFASDMAAANKVLAAVQLALAEFNLHLSAEKTHGLARPFVTLKSKLIYEADLSLASFFSKFIKTGQIGSESYSYPRSVRNQTALLRSLLDSIKGTCLDHQAGYELTSNYVIGALVTRIRSLINGYDKGMLHEQMSEEVYIDALLLLLEAAYFFYNVDPTVPSSLRLAQAAVQCAGFFREKLPDRLPFLAEQIVRWTFQFIRGLGGATVHRDTNCVPLEALNILLVFGEVGREEALARQTITEFCGTVGSLQYFELISFLFCMGSSPDFVALRDSLFERARSLVKSGLGIRTDAQTAHLALDVLACPHIEKARRAALFNELRSQVGLPVLSAADSAAAIDAFEANPWFVDWKDLNLLRMIRKKELSAVY
jgi:hypothetical protein